MQVLSAVRFAVTAVCVLNVGGLRHRDQRGRDQFGRPKLSKFSRRLSQLSGCLPKRPKSLRRKAPHHGDQPTRIKHDDHADQRHNGKQDRCAETLGS